MSAEGIKTWSRRSPTGASDAIVQLAIASALFSSQVEAIEIKIDYRFDDANFFDTAEKRAAMESVANFYGSLLSDTLLAIDASEFSQATWSARTLDPETGGSISIPDLIVPENTMIVFVGSRVLNGSTLGSGGPGGFSASGFSNWISRVRSRGNPGADFSSDDSSLKTDHAPWGGAISFDRDREFNFSQNPSGQSPNFVTVALHEMAHVLGIGTSDSWDNLISDGSFVGDSTLRSVGSFPSVTSNGGHFDGTSLTSPFFGEFGTPHGVTGPVLMLEATTIGDPLLDVATDLDLSALIDIGWEVSPPPRLIPSALIPTDVELSWPSSSFASYQIERGTNLSNFAGLSPVFAGNRLNQTWTDPSPPTERAFYRLVMNRLDSPAAASSSSVQSRGIFQTVSQTARVVDHCLDGCETR